MLTKQQLKDLADVVDQVKQVAHEKAVSPEAVATVLLATQKEPLFGHLDQLAAIVEPFISGLNVNVEIYTKEQQAAKDAKKKPATAKAETASKPPATAGGPEWK